MPPHDLSPYLGLTNEGTTATRCWCECTQHRSIPQIGTSCGEPSIARLTLGLRKPSFGVPGCDVAGRVEAVGPDVTTFVPGDAVYATTFMHGFGAFAERVAVVESLVARKPSNLTFKEAAAVPLAASTALQGLRDHGTSTRANGS